MIGIRKLRSLPAATRVRKCANLLHAIENDLLAGKLADRIYLDGLFLTLADEKTLPLELRETVGFLRQNISITSDHEILRGCNDLRHRILTHLGTAPADWDLYTVSDQVETTRVVLPFTLYLDDIRSPFNIGAIFRTAESFGVSELILSPGSADPDHPRARRTAMGCIEKVSWKWGGLEDCPQPLFCLECGGISLSEFSFPTTGTMIIGSEELGVSPEGIRMAEEGLGKVSITQAGSKGSLNVSVAFGIVMHAWFTSSSFNSKEF